MNDIINRDPNEGMPAKDIIHDDDVCTYMRLSSKLTNVATPIFVDDCGSYKMFHHPIYVLFQNGDEFIPINIEEEPSRLVSTDFCLQIGEEVLADVFRFVANNRETIILLAQEKITQVEFTNKIILP